MLALSNRQKSSSLDCRTDSMILSDVAPTKKNRPSLAVAPTAKFDCRTDNKLFRRTMQNTRGRHLAAGTRGRRTVVERGERAAEAARQERPHIGRRGGRWRSLVATGCFSCTSRGRCRRCFMTDGPRKQPQLQSGPAPGRYLRRGPRRARTCSRDRLPPKGHLYRTDRVRASAQ